MRNDLLCLKVMARSDSNPEPQRKKERTENIARRLPQTVKIPTGKRRVCPDVGIVLEESW
jgi:restriction endonuclease